MNISKKTHGMVLGGIIAALYVALTYAQEAVFPNSTSMAVQFRLSEALTMLCVFTPYAIPGLTVGCMLTNIMTVGVLPTDIILGSLATFLAGISMYKTRNIRIKELPILAGIMPAIFNGVIIGAQIEVFYIEGPFNFSNFLVQGSLVALGEIVVCMTVGLLLVKTIKNKKIEKYLNSI